MNVGASSPEDFGDKFAWGETALKGSYEWTTYKWCKGRYDTMTKYCNRGSYGYNSFTDTKTVLDAEDDAARANWGGDWRMPTKADFQELINNTKIEFSEQNGVKCLKFTGAKGKYIFLPATCEICPGESHFDGDKKNCGYWTSTLTDRSDLDPEFAWYLYLDDSFGDLQAGMRFNGRNVRPVRQKTSNIPEGVEAVNLGLPSGTLWANMNVGANSPEDYGAYFAWGETTPNGNYEWRAYKWCNGSDRAITKYCSKPNYGNKGFTDTKTVLDAEDDAASANWGSEWRMPTKAELDELIANTKIEFTKLNGVNGLKFIGANDKFIFLPAGGDRWPWDIMGAGETGGYWLSTLNDNYPFYAWYLCFEGQSVVTNNGHRKSGRTIRPVRKK